MNKTLVDGWTLKLYLGTWYGCVYSKHFLSYVYNKVFILNPYTILHNLNLGRDHVIHGTAGIENVTHHQKDIASREYIQKKETILSMRKEEIIQKIMIDTQKMSIRRFLQDIETGRLYIYFHFSYNSKKKTIFKPW